MKNLFLALALTLTSASAFAFTFHTQDNVNYIVGINADADVDDCLSRICEISEAQGTGECSFVTVSTNRLPELREDLSQIITKFVAENEDGEGESISEICLVFTHA